MSEFKSEMTSPWMVEPWNDKKLGTKQILYAPDYHGPRLKEAEEEIAKLKQQLEEADFQIDTLLKIADAEDSGMRYADIIRKAYEWDKNFPQLDKETAINLTIKNEILKAKQEEKDYEEMLAEFVADLNISFGDMEDKAAMEIEAVNLLVDELVERFTYKAEDYPMTTFMKKGAGKCWHIAKLFRDACRLMGIKADMVKGYAAGGRHCWNVVYLEGAAEPLYVDVTWELKEKEIGTWVMRPESVFANTHYGLWRI